MPGDLIRQVTGQRLEVAEAPRRVGAGQPFLKLAGVDPALRERLAERPAGTA